VQRLARENGLWFPPDPGAAEQSQIGGNVATNAGGPHAFRYGSTGNWVTGLEAVVAPGELVAVGGGQRKDVGGYDVKSLLVGSEGTLGIVTGVTLRLLPAPERALPLVAFFADVAAGCAAVAEIIATGIEAAVLDYLDGSALEIVRTAYPGSVPDGAAFALLAEADGSRLEAEQRLEDLRSCLGDSALALDTPAATALWRWRDGVSVAVGTELGGKASEDVFVPVARLAEALAAIHAIGDEVGLRTSTWGHAGDGNLHASFLFAADSAAERERANAAAQRLFDMAISLGGGITGEHGIGWVKRGQLSRQWSERAVDLHERIKACLDPDGVLNPGKKLARA
jgi:FAD/FMN-containing dehydrogenase